jgi:hypothetical protein
MPRAAAAARPDGRPVTDNVDYWAQISTDGGKSWGASTRLTASSFPASVAPQAGGLMIGDYEALTSVGDTFVAAFQVDNANPPNPPNPTDIQLATFPG